MKIFNGEKRVRKHLKRALKYKALKKVVKH